MTEKNLVKIVCFIIDTEYMTLYREDGTSIRLKQGDPRLTRIAESDADVQIGRNGYAMVDLSEANAYHDYEKNSNGAVRFFRIAKKKLKELMGKTDHVEPTKAGNVPPLRPIDEIMAHAVSSEDPQFFNNVQRQRRIAEDGYTPNDSRRGEVEKDDEQTIVAVSGGKVIPGMERIETQFARANKLGNSVGVKAFLARLNAVIDERSHSVDDLLRFMERGDMPICDDGSILVYKSLNSHDDDTFVDCHSGNVKQKVGSDVFMSHALVDPNRRNECSNGLHIARRGYIRNFTGNVVVVAKLAPEDVIAVPDYDANKMRVCGYHIVAKLSPELADKIRANQPMTDLPEGKTLTAKLLRGDHVGILQQVEIGGHRGTNIKITNVGTGSVSNTKSNVELAPDDFNDPMEAAPKFQDKADALEDREAEGGGSHVSPADMVRDTAGNTNLSRKEKVNSMVATINNARDKDEEREAFAELNAFRKSCKVSWEKLGISAKWVQMYEIMNQPVATPAPVKEAPKASVKKTEPKSKGKSYSQQVKDLQPINTASKARKVLEIKKASKKGLKHFGLTDAEVKFINQIK